MKEFFWDLKWYLIALKNKDADDMHWQRYLLKCQIDRFLGRLKFWRRPKDGDLPF